MAAMARDEKPKYAQLEGHLRGLIRSGQLKPGHRLPSELDLAAEHAVSPGTVRRALAVLIQEGLLKPQHRSGVYVQAVPRQKLIGIMVPNVSNPDHAGLVEAVTRGATARGLAASLLCRGNPDGTYRKGELLQYQFIDRMAEWRAAGIVACPTNPPIEALVRARMRQRHIPFVVVNDYWTDCPDHHHVQVDQEAAAILAVEHLVELGHRRIVWWAQRGDDWPAAANTFLGRLRSHGLPCDPAQQVVVGKTDWLTTGLAMAQKGSFTAMVVPYYLRACRILETLRAAGFRIPKDLSCVCLGGLPAPVPPDVDFTATINPIDSIAGCALGLLLDGNAPAAHHLRFKPAMHLGRTTAPPAKGKA